jgi:hypothetical protein
MKGARNTLKLKTLAVLERAGRAMEVPELAVAVSYYPVDGFFSYCRSLEKCFWTHYPRSYGVDTIKSLS